MKDVADSDIVDSDGACVIAVKPKAAGACPFRLELRQDRTFDVVLDELRIVNQPIADLDFFLPFVEAIAAGHVVNSKLSSAATGMSLFRTSAVEVGDVVWTPAGEPHISDVATGYGLGVVRQDTHFIAYRG